MTTSKEDHFKQLVEDHYQNLYRFAYSLAKSPDDASDLTQQTFAIWAKKGDSLKDKSKAKSWLFTTLYREFLRVRRKNKPETGVETDFLESAPDRSILHIHRKLEGQEAIELLNDVDEVYREALSLFYLDDLSYKEIAEILDSPIGTVMSRISRGKIQLKSLLTEKIRN